MPCILALGAAILASSRPLEESFSSCLCSADVLFVWLCGDEKVRRCALTLPRVILPFCCLMFLRSVSRLLQLARHRESDGISVRCE